MSKLQELINTLCPNGVEFKPLWELTIWDKRFNGVERHKQPQIKTYPYLLAKDMLALESEGNVKLLSTGEYVGWTSEELAGSNLCEGEVVTMPWGGTVKGIKYYNGKFVTADNRIATSRDTKILNNKFLYYIFLQQQDTIQSFYRGAGIQHPDMYKMLHLLIPVPPIEVQEEIVKILDRFSDYAAELQAELQARKEQYEYYRNLLLTFDPSAYGCGTDDAQEIGVNTWGGGNYAIQFKAMGEIGDTITDFVAAGSFADLRKNVRYHDTPQYAMLVRTTDLKNAFTKDCVYVDENAYNYLWRVQLNRECLILPNVGNCGEIYYLEPSKLPYENNVLGPNAILFRSEKVSNKFLYYLMSCTYFQNELAKITSQAGQGKFNKTNLKTIKVPIPPLEIQEKIVSILDRFETLVNDLANGLPAEIAAVKEQYEYYRNKLLTFNHIA